MATGVLVHMEPVLTYKEVRNTLKNHWICNFKSEVASPLLKMEKSNFGTQKEIECLDEPIGHSIFCLFSKILDRELCTKGLVNLLEIFLEYKDFVTFK